MNRSRTTIALVIGVLLSAPGSAQESWGGSIDERDGVRWVSNPDEPLWPDDGAPRITLELEQVYGSDESPEIGILARPQFVDVDGAGNVYVFDGQDHNLIAFEPNGDVLWRAGQQGQGPGELNRVRGLVWNGANRLYVATQAGTRIDAWDLKGNYLSSLALSDFEIGDASFFSFAQPGELFLLPMTSPAAQGHVLTIGPPWRLDRSFTMAAAPEVDMPGRSRVGSAARLTGGHITFGSVFDYEFRIFGLDGTLGAVVKRPAEGFVPAAIDMERGSVGSMGNASPPLRLPDGEWFVTASWPTNVTNGIAALRESTQMRRPMTGNGKPRETRTVLDLFDAGGRWLTGLVWEHPDRPDFGTLHMFGLDGRLYTTVWDPFPQIRRYHVTLRPSD
ncbi:MAG: hypothetical protein GKS06_08035 [Acidobacteria bacterium]|nr:hypothetical protein [Acidobacteriota bacterium]